MLQISPILAFDDNYIWLLRNPDNDMAVVVDPGDEAPVLEKLKQDGLTLAGMLITHKHGDHTGGLAGLKAAWPGIPVYGPASEPINGVTVKVKEGDRVSIPALDSEFRVIDVPGHTEGHVAYYGEGALFCGDTLFAGGCGRVFSGTYEQLHDSLRRIAALPPDTQVYCAHEYTRANIGFARWVEPDSDAIKQREEVVGQMCSRGEPTVPSTLQMELDTNPFMRTDVPAVKAAAERYTGKPLIHGAEIFTAVRCWKDREYD